MTDQQLPTERHESRQSAIEEGFGYYSELETFLEFENGESNGANSPDLKGSANDKADDGESVATHISEVCHVDHEDRRSVTSEVNEDASTPRKGDIDPPERDKSDDEVAQKYRERYGHLDSHTSKRERELNSWA